VYRVTEPRSPEQFEKIYALRFAVLREPWNQPKGSERDQTEDTAIHAMIENEAGECIATGRLQYNSADEAQIRYMAVDENYRGQKLGQLILEFLESRAKTDGCPRVVLQARENAVAFYERMGYVIEAKTFLLFDAIQHYRMTKSLF
jgi:predicted GNAT family N-acyltransferase